MKTNKIFSILMVLALLMAAAPVTSAGASGTVVVQPSSMNGWFAYDDGYAGGATNFVSGPAGTPAGDGSLQFTLSGSARMLIGTPAYAGTRLDQITNLQYSTYRSSSDAGNLLAVTLQFDMDYDLTDSTTTWQSRLVFEPYFTAGSGNILQNNWDTWMPRTGKWWMAGTPIVADTAVANPCPQSSPCTWGDMLSNFPNAGLRAGVGMTWFKAGGPWTSFDGNVDAFTIGISGDDTTYDFEPETPCTTVCYADAVNGNDAFGGGTPANAKKTIQAAIDAVDPGGQVRVLPGDYDETAANRWVLGTNGPHQFGLFIDKDGVTIQGVDASDAPITDYNSLQAYITTNATNNFGYSGIFVQGDNVTLAGLQIGPNTPWDNKTIEIIGNAFTLKDSHVDVPGGGSVYFGDWRFDTNTDTSYIQTYTVDHNLIDQSTSIDFANGAGYSGPETGRQIINNKFENSEYWPSISFNGSGTGVPWFVDSVGGAVIENNTFTNTFNGTNPTAGHIRVRGTVDDIQFDWTSYWNNNTFNKAVVILDGAYPPFNVRQYNYMSGTYSFDVRRIGVSIQGSVDKAEAGDTVLVKDGTYNESPNINKPLTLKSWAGRDVTTIQLQTGSTYLGGLTINASGATTVDGFTIRGFDAVGSGLASTNIVVTTLPDDITIQNNRIKVGAVGSGSNGDDGMGLNTYYNTASDINSLTVKDNIFEPLNTEGQRAFYINPGVLNFHFKGNIIQGYFKGTAITQAKAGLVEENMLTGSGTAGNRSRGFGTWGYPDPSMSYGATTFRNNVISGTSRGIAIYNTNNIAVENNYLFDNGVGVWVGTTGLTFDPSTIYINKNSIENHDDYGVENSVSGSVDATVNWWNSADGPTPTGSGDTVSGDVNYTPWLCVDVDTSTDIGYQPLVKTDCEAPITSDVTANPNPSAINVMVAVTATVDDTLTGNSPIASAEFNLNGGMWAPLDAADGTFDEASELVTRTFTAPGTPGIYNLCVRGTDNQGNVGTEACTMLVVYDPSGGFVTGGGWITSPAGAYVPDPSLTGKATFGFVSKYKKGASVPDGNTEFQFNAGNLNFHSTSYEWLVVTGSNYAKFKGEGTINGQGNYKFQIWAGDGTGVNGEDQFRIKIWDAVTGDVIYDNGMDQNIGGGSIVVHTKK